MNLTLDDVKRLAVLARIAIDEQEGRQILGELQSIFGLIEQMQAVDTSGVEPMSHAQDVVQRLRPDQVTERDQRQLYQSIAPRVEDGLYLVPKVIE